MRPLRTVFESKDLKILLSLAQTYYRHSNWQVRETYTPARTKQALDRAAVLLRRMEAVRFTGDSLEIIREEDAHTKPRS